jgi:two-component SAPR family response regulator
VEALDVTIRDVDAPPVEPLDPLPNYGGASFIERDWRVMVRLLGPIDVVDRDGRSAAGDRDQPLELLAWLVTHRDHATRVAAMEAMWGGRRVEARTFINIVSRARNLLRSLAGEPPDGEEWIPTRRERLLLHSSVVSDYDLLLDRLAFARQASASAAAAVLSSGVALVRGAPLAGAEWEWADDQSLRSRLAIQTVELATRLARLRLGGGDLRGAAEAADIGQTVIPFHDECTALAIEALAQGGDQPAARARYHDYERRAIATGEPVAHEVARVRNALLRN